MKCAVADVGHTVGDGDGHQRVTIFKRPIADGFQAAGQRNGRHSAAIFESVVADIRHPLRHDDRGQVVATVKRVVADRFHGLRDGDRRHIGTIIKRAAANGGDAAADHDRFHGASVGSPGTICAVILKILHSALAIDGQHAVAVQLPGHLAAVQPVFRIHRAAAAAADDVRRQRIGDKAAPAHSGGTDQRQQTERHDRRQQNTQCFFHLVFPSFRINYLPPACGGTRLRREQSLHSLTLYIGSVNQKLYYLSI